MCNSNNAIFLLLLFSCCMCQRTAFTEISNWNYTVCDKPSVGDNSCYEKVTSVFAAWMDTSNNDFSYIVHVGAISDNKDICNNIYTRYFDFATTCTKFFCPVNTSLAHEKYITDIFYWIPSGPINYISNLILVTNFCYYCNHRNRKEFHEQLSAGNCTYFWRHDPSLCGIDASQIEPVTALDPFIFSKGAQKYLNYAKTIDPALSSLSTYNLSDVLALTIHRNRYNDHLGETGRNEYIYTCYCYTMGRFGAKCDAYTAFFIPFKWLALPYIAIFTKFAVLLVIVWVNVIPYIWRDITESRLYVKQFMKLHLGDLKVFAAYFMALAVLFQIVEEPAYLTAFDTKSSYYEINGVFRSISYALIGLCQSSLLVLWVHVYDNFINENPEIEERMSNKNKILLIIMYFLFGLIIIASVALGTFLLLQREYQGIIMKYFFSSLSWIAIVCSLVLSTGFIIYGIRMFRVVRTIQVGAKVWRKKFMRFMIGNCVMFFVFAVFLLLSTVCLLRPTALGLFMDLFHLYVVDTCSLLLACLMVFLLSDTQLYCQVPCYRMLCCCLKKKQKSELSESLIELNTPVK